MATSNILQHLYPPPSTSNSNSNHMHQSVRSSCERCRSQKLKCTMPSDAHSNTQGPCNRCARAKVQCVFARRRQTSRTSGFSKGAETKTFNKESLATPASSPAFTVSAKSPCLSLDDPEVEASVGQLPMYEMPYGDGLDDIFRFATEQSGLTYSPQPEPFSNGSMEDSSSTEPQLLTLLSEMEQGLKMLQGGPWRFGSIDGLDTYPIGTILHLSQQFSYLVGPILRDTSERCNGATLTESTGLDTPAANTLAAVLVLSGYMSLRRIYSIVLSHLQTHLSLLPSQRQCLAGKTASPTLQMGELPYVNTTRGLSQVHTALCMLQDSLNGVEDQLGYGGAIARDVVITLLRNEAALSSGSLQDESSELGKQATVVKGLLREKMSF